MENAFLDFKLANNGWKVDYLASTMYPAWQKGMLDDNGKWKQKKGREPKIEDNNNDESMDNIGMKWKALVFKSEGGPEKCFKGEHTEESDQTLSSSTISLLPPSDTSITSFESSTMALPTAILSPFPDSLCDHEKETIQYDANTTTGIMSIDPLAALTLATSKA
ncbi:hypothetical protein PISMIDRAFT_15174 [Pisolithus microcarpus 441]|uniref:Unplaced genomic scaffold scaffold_147, whole genome shotgun sequence n=1 Tax=Pisolithus microcarpus 441 TaxID=765257 RepID=A0A0C9YTJ3_9AGAM|nr:hypothetical protein BKA83DRAFT_15174 [Pisolithus microcarpus]KIK17359.1 hypothetical protein PISMIDRAFT_15174 [Pisolithus microcarpus 441]